MKNVKSNTNLIIQVFYKWYILFILMTISTKTIDTRKEWVDYDVVVAENFELLRREKHEFRNQIRVFVRDRTVRELAREREGVREEVRDRPMVRMKSTIKRNVSIICQLVISYFICLILTAIFIRYMFVL